LSFELEQGAVKGAPAHAVEFSLYDRNPLLFWQVTTILLVLTLIASLTLH
jgi:hypothetical protein